LQVREHFVLLIIEGMTPNYLDFCFAKTFELYLHISHHSKFEKSLTLKGKT
jgi:hypothetical protein